MRYLAIRQIVALWCGVAVVLFVLAFPPPASESESWPTFAYATTTERLCGVLNADSSCNQYRTATRREWMGTGPFSYFHRVEMPIFAIVLVTGALVITLSPRKTP